MALIVREKMKPFYFYGLLVTRNNTRLDAHNMFMNYLCKEEKRFASTTSRWNLNCIRTITKKILLKVAMQHAGPPSSPLATKTTARRSN